MMLLTVLADAFRRNPYPVYSVLRRVSPVIRLRDGIWALLGHDDVKRALVDQEAYSSRAAVPGATPLDWMIFQDPPRHTALRALVTRTFAPRAVADLEMRIRAIANSLLDEVASSDEMDLVTDFAERLPLLVISDMLGVPHADAPRMTRWGDAIIHVGDALYGGERAAAGRDGDNDQPHCQHDALLLQPPGGVRAHPGNPALLPAAIEEVLRFRSPVQMVFRVASRYLTVGGRTIPRGALVLIMIGSANRDTRHFQHADRFDVTRTGVPHVGLGHGAHYCVGAALGRLEARVAVAALLDRIPDVQRAGRGRWAPRTGINVHGPRSLPVRFTSGRPVTHATV